MTSQININPFEQRLEYLSYLTLPVDYLEWRSGCVSAVLLISPQRA